MALRVTFSSGHRRRVGLHGVSDAAEDRAHTVGDATMSSKLAVNLAFGRAHGT